MPNPNPMYAAFTPQQAEQSKKHPDKIWNWREIRHYMPLKMIVSNQFILVSI